jgi:hypothetical protein
MNDRMHTREKIATELRREPWQKANCPHTSSGICVANDEDSCVCQHPHRIQQLLESLNEVRLAYLGAEHPAWAATRGKRLIDQQLTLWTIYDHPHNIAMYAARRTQLPVIGSLVEAYMFSSDLDAIRGQLMQLGLTCYGRDPEDDLDIIEVWL